MIPTLTLITNQHASYNYSSIILLIKRPLSFFKTSFKFGCIVTQIIQLSVSHGRNVTSSAGITVTFSERVGKGRIGGEGEGRMGRERRAVLVLSLYAVKITQKRPKEAHCGGSYTKPFLALRSL